MDYRQTYAFCDFMIGYRNLGGTDDDPVTTPYSPELYAFIISRLGELMPRPEVLCRPSTTFDKKRTLAFIGLLRELADDIEKAAIG
jgi:hypothetical protein